MAEMLVMMSVWMVLAIRMIVDIVGLTVLKRSGQALCVQIIIVF